MVRRVCRVGDILNTREGGSRNTRVCRVWPIVDVSDAHVSHHPNTRTRCLPTLMTLERFHRCSVPVVSRPNDNTACNHILRGIMSRLILGGTTKIPRVTNAGAGNNNKYRTALSSVYPHLDWPAGIMYVLCSCFSFLFFCTS